MTEDEARADIERRFAEFAEASAFRRIEDIDVEDFRQATAETFGVLLEKISAHATPDGVLRARLEP